MLPYGNSSLGIKLFSLEEEERRSILCNWIAPRHGEKNNDLERFSGKVLGVQSRLWKEKCTVTSPFGFANL